MLKRIIVLALLFGMMFGLEIVTHGFSGDLFIASQTLSSIGFTALFAFTVGEIFGAFKLPRVTGYILTGIVLGPHLSEIFSSTIVERMQMFNTLALGLIALSAGLELDMRGTWRLMKTLGVTILLKIVALLVLVGGAFVAIEMIWSPFKLDMSQTIAVALIIATLGIGTSPAIALAILNDTGAKGRLSELLLSMAVLKDLVVVVSLAIAMAVVNALLSGGGFDPHSLVHVAEEIGASILAGSIIGGLTIAYIRFVHQEMLFFVVAMILAVAQISAILHLELLLVFIVAGFLVRNFSPYEHDLLHPLEVVALPVFVVFFTTAGANIDLGKTWAVLPIAIALFAARGVAFFAASKFGALICKESEAIAKHSWMSYLPQAGVTLGLVTIAVGKLSPEGASETMVRVAEVMEPLGVALVALNLLVGPVTVGIALKKAGEVPEEASDEDAHAAESHDAHASTPKASTLTIEPQHEELDPQKILLSVQDIPLDWLAAIDQDFATDTSLQNIATELDKKVEDMTLEVIDLLEQQLVTLFEILPNEYSHEEFADIAIQWQRHAQCGESQVSDDLDHILRDLFPSLLGALPKSTLTKLHSVHLDASDENTMVKVRAAVRRASVRFLPNGEAAYRKILVKQSARAVLEPGLLAALLDWMTALANAQNTFFGAMVGALESPEPRQNLLDTMQAQIDYARARARSAWRHGWVQALEELITELNTLDTPVNPSTSVSYSKAEHHIQERLKLLKRARKHWRLVHSSTDAHVIARASNIVARHELVDLLDSRFIQPEKHITEEIHSTLDIVIQRLSMIESHVSQVVSESDEKDKTKDKIFTPEELEELGQQVEQCYDSHLQKQLRRLVHQHGGRQLLAELQKEIEHRLAQLPSELEMLNLEDTNYSSSSYHLNLQDLFRQNLLSEFFTELLKEHGEFSEVIAQVPSRTMEALHAIQYALELVARGRISQQEDARQHIQTSFSRGLKQLEEIKEEITQDRDELEQDIHKQISRSFEEITSNITQPPRFDGIRFVQEGLRHPLVERVEQRTQVLRKQAIEHFKQLQTWVYNLSDREEVRDLRIRRGIDKLSSRQMKQWLEDTLPAPSQLPIDSLIHQLFSLDPVDDRRLFVSRNESTQLLEAVERWKHHERVSIVVKGPIGSGKSSLIDNHLFDIGATNLYRLDRRFWQRTDGLLRALSFEIGVRENLDVMARKLNRGQHVIIVDGLEQWLAPDISGFEQWRTLRKLISKTPSTLWIVSTHDGFYNLLAEALPWDVAFTDIIQMSSLSTAKLMEIMDLRHRLSGYDYNFPEPSVKQRVLIRREDNKTFYFEDLNKRSSGDIRAAIYLHLRAMSQQREDISLQPLQSQSIPFLQALQLEEQAVLLSLLQFAQLPRKSLQNYLSTPSIETFEILNRLNMLGLIQDASSHDEIYIPFHLRRPLLLELSTHHTQEVSS